jgi:NADH:ubiquinone oxidoreductase subunit K
MNPMLRTALIYGIAAGLIVAVPMFSLLAMDSEHTSWSSSQLFGYSLMILALSLIFVGVKSYRDKVKGGVIKFGPAFLVGLGISVVASVIYVVGWEITQSLMQNDFASGYANSMIEAAREKGASPAEIEAMSTQMTEFQHMYANPLFRLPMTFIEIFPVGLIISLIAAALLRNPRFMPARA